MCRIEALAEMAVSAQAPLPADGDGRITRYFVCVLRVAALFKAYYSFGDLYVKEVRDCRNQV